MNLKSILFSWVTLLAVAVQPGFSAEVPKAPVPVSPFIRVVYGYADAMLKNGRDNHGPQKTGLFLSALDRQTLAPLTNRPGAPKGVRAGDRVGFGGGALAGANPLHDENLLCLLSTLTDLSAKPHYRAAADAELKWFLENPLPLNSQLRPWEGRESWEVMSDKWASPPAAQRSGQGAFRPWLLWDRCFALAPEASRNLAQLATNATDSPRDAGFCVRALAAAYVHTKEEQLLREMEALLSRCEKQRSSNTELPALLSLAIDCDGAAQRVPEPLAARLRALAARVDEQCCSLPHGVKMSRGFLIHAANAGDAAKEPRTPLWEASAASHTTAQMGMMCVSRYDNSGRVGYRDLIFAAADSYLDSLPGDDDDVWPGTFGHAISLELAAWRHSANWKYMARARRLGEIAVEKFWGTSALPRASLKTAHYESITGADTLPLARLELHLQILHITAVRCPANTMDR
jgi:hypothetical protein